MPVSNYSLASYYYEALKWLFRAKGGRVKMKSDLVHVGGASKSRNKIKPQNEMK